VFEGSCHALLQPVCRAYFAGFRPSAVGAPRKAVLKLRTRVRSLLPRMREAVCAFALCMRSNVVALTLISLVGCAEPNGSPEVPAPVTSTTLPAPSKPSSSPPPTSAPNTDTPLNEPPATASEGAPEGYEECKTLRPMNSTALDPTQRAAARSAAMVWPPLCATVPGWAGISMVRSVEASGFAANDRRFVVCGTHEDCTVLDLASGTIIQRVKPNWPNGLDGSPVTRLPEIAQLFHSLGAPATEGRFPYADDLRISWKIGKDAGALDVTLASLDLPIEETLHHFPGGAKDSEMPIVLEATKLSPSGGVLELQTFAEMGGTGFEVALVNLHASAARIYRRLANDDPAHSKEWREKAEAAELRARDFAQSFAE
jgi:hypothetical protein